MTTYPQHLSPDDELPSVPPIGEDFWVNDPPMPEAIRAHVRWFARSLDGVSAVAPTLDTDLQTRAATIGYSLRLLEKDLGWGYLKGKPTAETTLIDSIRQYGIRWMSWQGCNDNGIEVTVKLCEETQALLREVTRFITLDPMEPSEPVVGS